MADNNMNNAALNQSNVEVLIAEEILAGNGIIRLDEQDVKNLRDSSDFIDGPVVDGKLDELGKLADQGINSLKEAHPQDTLTMLMVKIRIAIHSDLLMEQMESIHDVFSNLDDDISFMWGVEVDAPVPEEVRICVLGGFKLK